LKTAQITQQQNNKSFQNIQYLPSKFNYSIDVIINLKISIGLACWFYWCGQLNI